MCDQFWKAQRRKFNKDVLKLQEKKAIDLLRHEVNSENQSEYFDHMVQRLDDRYCKKQMIKEIGRCKHESRELQDEVSLMLESEQLSLMEDSSSTLKRIGHKTLRTQQGSTETMTPKSFKESMRSEEDIDLASDNGSIGKSLFGKSLRNPEH